MMKTLLQVTLLSLAAQTAWAGDSCTFRPRANGAIDGYVEPKPAETAEAEKLIASLPDNFASFPTKSVTLKGVVIGYEGRGSWVLRRAADKTQPELAFVRGLDDVAQRWQADHGRTIKTFLLESLHTGRRFMIVPNAECH
ncbi:hypothetical protein GJ699_01185 [Duganella sp. FT80W]|uniref:Uncharacterized protein n=1 Tax=Duganella guangzhouensis TaxID=2666084 RepID=A0A6I2KW28_9BURK|nr:hypothetical protein [Duganella guangzhouensis]MRW88594.1 hypothetical protein [Duganella guangzhouensis]